MHDLEILRDLAIIVGLAIPVVALAHRVRVPPLVGFLLVGVVIGPSGVALIPDDGDVQAVGEIGVVLLLFAIGLELSLSRVLQWATSLLVSGGLQMGGMLALAAGVGAATDLGLGQGLFYGALVAMSSTAVVTRSYADRGELDSAPGREVISILLFQDLAIVPLMLLVPVFGGQDGGASGGVWSRLGLGITVMAVLVLGGRLVVRWTLDRIVATRDRELFTLCVAFFAIGTALVAASAGFTLAIGAFLAGLIISESEYGLQALSDVVPFRALFSGVFFMSVGMLLDVPFAVGEAPLLIAATAAVMLVKTVVATGAVVLRGRPLETGLISGLSLAQIGEFSFVLASAGLPLGLFAGNDYQVFLSVAALSMAATPFLIVASRPVARRVTDLVGATGEGELAAVSPRRDHAVVVGYGVAGRYLARMLRAAEIDCVVVDQNAELIRQARRDGLAAVYGDGTRSGILHHASCPDARLVVFAISSPAEERRGVAVAREAAPAATIVVRTRYIRAIDELMQLGANAVVVEEFEASLELFARALESYEIPAARIAHELDTVRSEHYGLLRGQATPDLRLDALKHLGIHDALKLVEVEEDAPAVGQSATILDLRRRTGAVQVAIIRDGHPIYERDPEFGYRVGDTAVLVGDRDALDRATALFRPA